MNTFKYCDRDGVHRMTALLNLIVMLGMGYVVPVGLRLIEPTLGRLPWTAVWYAGAVAGGVSLWLPRGGPAAALACGYAVVTLAVAARAPIRLIRRRSFAPREIAALTALASPAVAGVTLIAERYGYQLFGFKLRILALTVAHFHFAGFAAALVAALVCAATGDGPLARAAALSVPAGVAVVFTGFFAGEAVELVGTAVLTAGMWLVAWLTWREVRPSADRRTAALLAGSALVLVATMLLALSWALGRAADLPHPSLTWMVATHGVANALGFGVCSVLAWRRLLNTGPAPADSDSRRTFLSLP